MRPNVTAPDNPKTALYDAAAKVIKEFIWRNVLRFTPARRPICLYGSRRSGSSLLMEVIAVNRGVLYSDQPFGAYTANSVNLNKLPLFPYGQIAFPDPDEEQLLKNYVAGLFDGSIRANWPWKLFGPECHLRNDRICLKITDAKCMIEWIDRTFDVDTVVLTRHPISQALSVRHVGWLVTGKGLLRNPGYVSHWLNDEQVARSWEIYRNGTELEWRVLDWTLENLPMLRLLPQHPAWLYVSYEDILARPETVVDRLCEKLELESRENMLQRLRQPSRSTRRETSRERKSLIEAGDRHGLLSSWQARVSPQEIDACFEILRAFDIHLYTPNSIMPDPTTLGRPAFPDPPCA